MIGKFALIGEKLSHTYSPFIHKEILKYIGLNGTYDVLEFKKDYLPNIVDNLKHQFYRGVNVTIPYKTDIIPYLDEISPEAQKIGAINTVNFLPNKTIGYNTDYFGFGKLLNNNKIDIVNKSALILGTGGASRAVKKYLEDNNIRKIKFASTDNKQTKNKYSGYEIYSYNELNSIEEMDIIINCTPVGMYGTTNSYSIKDFNIVNESFLSKFDIAIDLIYNPLETLFLKEARRIGLKTTNGLYMLVAQAVKAQEIWNDIFIDDSVIDKVNYLIENKIRNVI